MASSQVWARYVVRNGTHDRAGLGLVAVAVAVARRGSAPPPLGQVLRPGARDTSATSISPAEPSVSRLLRVVPLPLQPPLLLSPLRPPPPQHQPPPILPTQHHLDQAFLPFPVLDVAERDLVLVQPNFDKGRLTLRVLVELSGEGGEWRVVLAPHRSARQVADARKDLGLGPPAERDLAGLVVLEVDDGELAEERVVVLECEVVLPAQLRSVRGRVVDEPARAAMGAGQRESPPCAVGMPLVLTCCAP